MILVINMKKCVTYFNNDIYSKLYINYFLYTKIGTF